MEILTEDRYRTARGSRSKKNSFRGNYLRKYGTSELSYLLKKFIGLLLQLFGTANLHKLIPLLNLRSSNWYPYWFLVNTTFSQNQKSLNQGNWLIWWKSLYYNYLALFFLNSQSSNWHPLINIQGCLVIWHCENCAINQTMIACNKI